MGKPSAIGQPMILILDGHEVGTVAYLGGGDTKRLNIEQPIGASASDIRQVSTLELEPFVVAVGALRPVLGWIGALLSRQYARRSFELRQGREILGLSRQAFDCLLTEIAFPPLDRRSAGDAYLKLKVQPERAENRRNLVPRRHSPPMLPLSSNAFRLSIDGALDGHEVQRVEAFTIRSGFKKYYVGEERLPTLEPTKLEFPNFALHLPPAQAQRLKSWHDATMAAQGPRRTPPREGSLGLFSRGGTRALTLELAGLDIISLSGMNSALAKVDIACGRITLGG